MKNQAVIVIVLYFSSLATAILHQPFTPGNVLALKHQPRPVESGDSCSPGWIVEFSLTGEIVQEVALPTTATDEYQACKIYVNNPVWGSMTIATDGYRAIVPCCNYDANAGISKMSVGIIYGNGHFETTPILQNTGTNQEIPKSVVMDGDDIWYTSYYVWHTLANSTSSTKIFNDQVDVLRIKDGNLYGVRNPNSQFSYTVAKIGDGLPRDDVVVASTAYIDRGISPTGFGFGGGFAFVSVNDGLYSFNASSVDVYEVSSGTGNMKNFVALVDQGKFVMQIQPTNVASTTIYGTDLQGPGTIAPLSSATALLSPQNNYIYYSPTVLPVNSCADKVKNFDETDVDCGGITCSKCDAGKQCSAPSDCSSNSCTNNKCDMPAPMVSPTTSTAPVGSIAPVASNTPTRIPQGKTSTASTIVPYAMSFTVLSGALIITF